MAKVGFCAVSGSGMSALAQISKYMGNDVYGSDRSFDQGKDQHNKLALENVGIKIFPQDGSMLDSDFNVLYASTAVEDTIPDIKKAREKKELQGSQSSSANIRSSYYIQSIGMSRL